MSKNNSERARFDPDNVPLLGSLGLLALGDVGFEAWRKAKIENNLNRSDEQE